MPIEYERFLWAKSFVGFDDAVDGPVLQSLAPVVAFHGPALTDSFYATLERFPETAAVVAGRVEGLKRTHARYLAEMVGGEYGEKYFASRVQVGLVHVQQGIELLWVEAVMNHIRAGLQHAIQREEPDAERRVAQSNAILRICDLDLLVINLAYAEERLNRLSNFTGMKRKLIENVLALPPAPPRP